MQHAENNITKIRSSLKLHSSDTAPARIDRLVGEIIKSVWSTSLLLAALATLGVFLIPSCCHLGMLVRGLRLAVDGPFRVTRNEIVIIPAPGIGPHFNPAPARSFSRRVGAIYYSRLEPENPGNLGLQQTSWDELSWDELSSSQNT